MYQQQQQQLSSYHTHTHTHTHTLHLLYKWVLDHDLYSLSVTESDNINKEIIDSRLCPQCATQDEYCLVFISEQNLVEMSDKKTYRVLSMLSNTLDMP